MNGVSHTGRRFGIAVALNVVAATAAFWLPIGSANAKISSQAKTCLTAVTKHYNGLAKPRPPGVLLVAAKNTCLITGDADAAKGYFFQISQPALVTTAGKLKIQIASEFKSTVKEPGLLGLNGAEGVLRTMLTKEAEYLWSEAAKLGGIPKPAAQTSSGGLQITTLTLSDNYGLGTEPKDFAEAYIRLVRERPGEATLLKARMWVKLKEIALRSGSKSKAESDYQAAVETYIHDQYVRVAQTALDKYYAWRKETDAQRAKNTSTNLGSIFDLGPVPPDFHAEAKAALALGAWGAATAALLTAVTGNVTATFAAVAPFAVKGTMAAVGVGAGMTTSASAIVSAAAGPAAIVVSALVVAGIAMDHVIKQQEAEPKLKKALAKAKATRISLKSMLNNREGTEQVLHFFAKATSDSSPAGYIPAAEGCRACLYEAANFAGESICTDGRIDSLKSFTLDGEARKFNNKPSSVKLENSKCANAHVILYENDRFGGDKVVVKESMADLKLLTRGKRANWNNAASSIAFSNKAAPQCEACLYDKPGYKGVYACVQGINPNLHAIKMGDKVQSVRLNTKDCPEAKIWLYNKKDLTRTKSGGGALELGQSSKDLGKGWKNNISSVAFVPTGINVHEERASGGCRVCLYEHDKYRGGYVCTDSRLADLRKTEPKFNNKATSVQLITDGCTKGDTIKVTLYSKADYKGKATPLTRSSANIGKEWNDAVTSLKFERTSAAAKAKKCEVCLFEHANYKGKSFCVAGNVEKLSSKKFSNKASSIKFNRDGCSKAYVRLYENPKYKSDTIKITGNVSNLGKLTRKKKLNWNDVSDSLKFYK